MLPRGCPDGASGLGGAWGDNRVSSTVREKGRWHKGVGSGSLPSWGPWEHQLLVAQSGAGQLRGLALRGSELLCRCALPVITFPCPWAGLALGSQFH